MPYIYAGDVISAVNERHFYKYFAFVNSVLI